jgi:hypothetical protein
MTNDEALLARHANQHALAQQAMDIIRNLIEGVPCRFAIARLAQRRHPGETCEAFRTWQQGKPTSACDICQARNFLRENGYRIGGTR